jgi:hypothetical protein
MQLRNVTINISTKKFTFFCSQMLPTDELNFYSCPANRPRHLSILVDNNDYRAVYPILVGGVMVFRPSHFLRVNGYRYFCFQFNMNVFFFLGVFYGFFELKKQQILGMGCRRRRHGKFCLFFVYLCHVTLIEF